MRFEVLYHQNCAGCHGADGKNGAAIDLANPEYQSLVDDASLTQVDQQRNAADTRCRRSRFLPADC